MAAVRKNILTDAGARQRYIEGVLALKAENTGVQSGSLGVPGTSQELSTYDLFILLHHRSMMVLTPPTQMDRNAAHSGPVFLPWHRFMLIFFEAQLQRVLADPDFGLPYWSWADDGELPTPEDSPLWTPECIGGNGDPAQGRAVRDGPFSGDAGWRVRLAANSNGVLMSVSRPLRREFNPELGLPRRADVGAAMDQDDYDASPWDRESEGYRNRIEGWVPPGMPHNHNRVHVFVGGDMLTSSSPNDPVFYLNHCNVDRVWAARLAGDHAPQYLPEADAPDELFRHRIDDPVFSIFTSDDDTRWTPRRMLDVDDVYSFDDLDVR